jgi:hypothetical protein
MLYLSVSICPSTFPTQRLTFFVFLFQTSYCPRYAIGDITVIGSPFKFAIQGEISHSYHFKEHKIDLWFCVVNVWMGCGLWVVFLRQIIPIGDHYSFKSNITSCR